MLSYFNVNLGKDIPGEDLESILKATAEEIGWIAQTEDKHRTSYHLSPFQLREEYESSELHLKSSGKEILSIPFHRGEQVCKVSILYEFGSPSTTKEEITRYLIAVSKHIEEYKEKAAE